MTTIDEVIGLLEDATFYYEILTDKYVDSEPTVDCLHRHVLEDFIGYATNSYEVLYVGNKQYLTMTLKLSYDSYSSEDSNLPITIDNMKLCFSEFLEMISKDGKLNIPYSFEDSVYPQDPVEIDSYVDSIDVKFKFHKVSDLDLLQYINLI